MANRAGPNDWLSADPVDDNGHVAYELNVNVVGGTGAPSNVTIVDPLGTQAIADSVAVNPATSSAWAVTQATASSLNAQVVGNVASGAADSGNPVKIGGKVETAAYGSALTNNTRNDALLTQYGWLKVSPVQSTVHGDGTALGANVSFMGNTDLSSKLLATIPYMFDGTNQYLLRGDATDGLLTQSNAIGAVDDAAWDGSAASATLIAIMKYCGQQLAAINTNTAGP